MDIFNVYEEILHSASGSDEGNDMARDDRKTGANSRADIRKASAQESNKKPSEARDSRPLKKSSKDPYWLNPTKVPSVALTGALIRDGHYCLLVQVSVPGNKASMSVIPCDQTAYLAAQALMGFLEGQTISISTSQNAFVH